MASSSSFHCRKDEYNALSGIESPDKRRKVDESSRLFDVFVNHRGPDVKKTVARRLYKSFKELGIRAFLDSEEKELGDSFPSTIESAIHSASAHVAIFSRRYAESPWCLAELVLMLQSRAKIIPVFYGVKPSALRHIESGEYAEAFKRYEEKGRYLGKLEEWKDALHSVSFITGHEVSSKFSLSDGQNIVSAVCKEVQRKELLHVAKYPLGLDRVVEDFESQCRMSEGGKEKAQIVGIFGMGGVGKTTLAKELFNRKRSEYSQACFLFDVREAYNSNKFTDLQKELLKDLYHKENLNIHCKEQATSHIAGCIGRTNQLSFLLVLDDIDHLEQLDALLIWDLLNKSGNCLVIVTTRDAGVLKNAGITVTYNLRGMQRDQAKELLCCHAFGHSYPSSGYEKLVDLFVEVCGGLPLSLKVLGSHVHGTDQEFWKLELEKVKKMLPQDIHNRLKISIDKLDKEEKQIFMDCACFFIGESVKDAIRVWEASGWSAQHALHRLKNKCLVEEIKPLKYRGRADGIVILRMHDHLRDLGREMAAELNHPPRLWRSEDLQSLESKGFKSILTQPKFRCLHSFMDPSMGCHIKYFLGESDNTFEPSTALLWLEVELKDRRHEFTSITSWIPLQKLQYLVIRGGSLERLWQNNEQAPLALKELRIYYIWMFELNLGLLRRLDVLAICCCRNLKSLTGMSELTKLVKLDITGCGELEELSLVQLSCLKEITIYGCGHLKSVTISDLTKLVQLGIFRCGVLEELSLVRLNSAEYIIISGCGHLKCSRGISDLRNLENLLIDCCGVGQPQKLGLGRLNGPKKIRIDGCHHLKSVRTSDLIKLEKLNIGGCRKLEELSLVCLSSLEFCSIGGLRRLERIEVKGCKNLISIDEPSWEPVECNIYWKLVKWVEKIPIEILHLLERVQILYCGNEAIRKYILNMKKLPSNFIKVIGQAADGAESTLNADLFCDFNSANSPHSVIRIGTDATWNHLGRHVVGTIILCAVVVVNTCAAAKRINDFVRDCDINPWLKCEVREGQWIITSVTSKQDEIDTYLVNKGKCFPFDYLCCLEDAMVKSVTIPVMRGEEHKVFNVLYRIVDNLYQK